MAVAILVVSPPSLMFAGTGRQSAADGLFNLAEGEGDAGLIAACQQVLERLVFVSRGVFGALFAEHGGLLSGAT